MCQRHDFGIRQLFMCVYYVRYQTPMADTPFAVLVHAPLAMSNGPAEALASWSAELRKRLVDSVARRRHAASPLNPLPLRFDLANSHFQGGAL